MKQRKETRLTVVDESGKRYERYDIEITESIQDNGKTLKLFVKNAEKKEDVKKMNIDELGRRYEL